MRARTIDSAGGLERTTACLLCQRLLLRVLDTLSHGHPLSECRVSCLAAVHLDSGLGQSWKVDKTVSTSTALLDMGASGLSTSNLTDSTV